MRLETRLECVGSSSRVSRVPGWRNGVRWKKTETQRKIVGGSRKACRELERPDMDPRSSLGIRLSLNDAVGARCEFARTSPKVSGRSLGTRWEIVGGKP
ncbi:hypothetical protein BHE74_00024552 [Ensete ventricosum]|nr:hypothetical protein GW17_00014226 [Ensete ventricosum]RWW67960.1 hypothetical protein BHE74_00024552 [Ensete ventricosum]